MQLLVCGIPGTGKSRFANWLVSEHGYVRCPHVEERFNGFVDDVNRALCSRSDVVIDWGFPAFDPGFRPCMDFLRELVRRHVEHWWFDGDRDAALHSFLKRGTVGRADWDRQLTGIEQRWKEISDVFAGRILNVISAGPSYAPNEELMMLMRREERGPR